MSPGAAFTFIDLFAGIGGMRAGFEQAGGACVFTSEWNRWAKRTYAANHGVEEDSLAGDITQVGEDDIPDHDVLVAGFPCQPFSIAGVSKKNALGRPHGFACATQGTLFFDVARIIAAKRPAAFLLENVKNLLSHDRAAPSKSSCRRCATSWATKCSTASWTACISRRNTASGSSSSAFAARRRSPG